MIDVAFPRRIDASGNTVKEYHPISMSLDLKITPLSTATMDLPNDENIPARSYVELFTPMGSAGFFRARSPEDAYGEDITSVELEHAITEVGDYLVKTEYDEMMAANTAMQTVFSHYAGGRWQLGSVAALGSDLIALSVKYDSVLDAMLAILEQKPNCYLAFDFSTTPWTVSIATKDSTVSAEGRLSRNIDSAKVIYDDTELCTRVYYEQEATTDSTEGMNLDGVPTFDVNAYNSAGSYVLYNSKLYLLPNGHESGETWANTTSVVQNNIPTSEWTYLDADTLSTYGLVERTVSSGSNYTAEEALKVAQEYLRTHKEPKVSVRIQGEELSSTTGEPLDAFTIGKLLRLALVDYDVTVEKNITGVSWNDVINEPESMEVLLGEAEDTAIKFLHDIDKKGSSGSSNGGSKKKQDKQWKEYLTEYEKDDYHYRLVAKHVDQSNNILQQAGIYIDANGVLQYAEDTEKNVGSKFKVAADRITSEVEARNQQGQALRSEIQQTATQIYQYVENEADDMRSEIRQTASRITLAVEKKSDNFFQFDDPKTSPPEGKTVTEGSIWVKSNDIRHYGDAEIFTWGDLGGYAWADFYGSEIYIWKNGEWKLAGNEQLENINRTRIDQTDEHIALIADSFDGNWSAFVVESNRIRSEVNSIKSNMGSIVEQTSEMIRSAVFTANSTLYSEIKQTATQIYSHIEDENNGLHSEINQTVSSIRTEVGTKSRVFRQWTNPVYDDATRPDGYHVQAGDFWVVDNEIHTYGQAETKTYGQLSQFDWKSFYGCTFYVYDGATWVKVSDDQLTQINHTYGEETRERFYRVAEDAAHNRAELELTKSKFQTQINTAKNEFGSSITQTAREIRSEVHAGQSTMYSEIRQTATNIMLHVADTKSGLESKIEVQKNRISLVVEDTNEGSKIKPASIVAAINDGESTVVIDADHIDLNGLVRASDLTANYLITKIGMATQVNTQRLNANTVTILPDGFQSSINVATGIKEVQISGPSSNTYKLQYKRYNQTSWQDAGSFSRAVSSWNVAGAGGKITVTASPQSQSREVACQIDGATSITANGDYYFKGQYQNASGTYSDIGGNATKKVTVNVASPSVSISIPTVEFSTGKPSQVGTYTNTETINKLLREKSGGYVYFQVSAGGTTRWYRITTPK